MHSKITFNGMVYGHSLLNTFNFSNYSKRVDQAKLVAILVLRIMTPVKEICY